MLYRAVNGKDFMSYKALDPALTSYQDYLIKPGLQYEYTIKVQFKDGRISDLVK